MRANDCHTLYIHFIKICVWHLSFKVYSLGLTLSVKYSAVLKLLKSKICPPMATHSWSFNNLEQAGSEKSLMKV